MRTDYLNESTVTLSNDTVAIRNKGDEKGVEQILNNSIVLFLYISGLYCFL